MATGPPTYATGAILMLLIAYGLRAGEVAGLRLDDLDWTEERLQVRRPKPGPHPSLSAVARGVRTGDPALHPRGSSAASGKECCS